MTAISNNRISVTLEEQALADIKAAFQTINNHLPFLIGLNKDEKSSMVKINVSNKQFVEDAITVINSHPDIFPAYVDGAEIKKDFILHTQLDELLHLSSQLTNKLSDTQMLAGSEAYSGSLMIYKMAGAASKGGLPGADAAYKMLSVRFSKQGPSDVNKNTDKKADS